MVNGDGTLVATTSLISIVADISIVGHNQIMKGDLEELEVEELSPGQMDLLEQVLEQRPSLVGREGFSMEMPDPIFHLLLIVVKSLRRNERLLLMPKTKELTTQAAADFLGVSRPFLVGLLEQNEIPFVKVGSHRRVRLGDLRVYRSKRGASGREGLSNLFGQISEEGYYDKVPE